MMVTMGVAHEALVSFIPLLIHIIAFVDWPSNGGDSRGSRGFYPNAMLISL
jgi:hypothetical protein